MMYQKLHNWAHCVRPFKIQPNPIQLHVIPKQLVGLQGNSQDCTNAPSLDKLQQRGNMTISKATSGQH